MHMVVAEERLSVKVTLKLRPEVEGASHGAESGSDSSAKSFRAEGTANANALEWGRAWHLLESTKRPMCSKGRTEIQLER